MAIHNPRRRRFLQAAASIAAAAPVIGCSGRRTPWKFFTAEEGATLSAICEQIVPTDQDPGAAWAGAVTFIDRYLRGHYKQHRKTYRDGIAAIDRLSLARFAAPFTALNAPRQIELLTQAEKEPSTRAFFSLAVTHTMQSFYGDPRHGGNRDAVSWKMIGVPEPPIRGRQQYDLTQGGRS